MNKTITIRYKRWVVEVATKYNPFSYREKCTTYGKFKTKEEALAFGQYIKENSRDYVSSIYAYEKEYSFNKVIEVKK